MLTQQIDKYRQNNGQTIILDRHVSLALAQQLVGQLANAEYQDFEFDGPAHRYPERIVPDVVHQILFKIHEIQFIHFISLLSVLKNHRPAVIVIHCDCNRLTGNYYESVVQMIDRINTTTLILREIEKPTHIFGKPLSRQFRNFHAGDIMRAMVLSEFGGIFLDNDIYVIKSLHEFRNYEMTFQVGRGSKASVGPQTLIVHRNARFLKIWIDSFHDYRPDLWFYTGGELPGRLAQSHRDITNAKDNNPFGIWSEVCPKLYAMYYPQWDRDYYTIHMFIRGNYFYHHGWCMHGYHTDILYYNETIVETVNNTFADMCRRVLHWERQQHQQQLRIDY